MLWAWESCPESSRLRIESTQQALDVGLSPIMGRCPALWQPKAPSSSESWIRRTPFCTKTVDLAKHAITKKRLLAGLGAAGVIGAARDRGHAGPVPKRPGQTNGLLRHEVLYWRSDVF
jgi:hypothetical protein